MRLLVTGAGGFLGWRAATLLRERGHDVLALRRSGGRARSLVLDALELDAGDPAARDLVSGRDAVLHFAGVPDPTKAREDPARAVRENAGTTLNLLEGCSQHGAGLVYPSTIRAATDPPPDEYALSKRLGEEACRLHRAKATVVRFSSVFGPGQLAAEGATGAIAQFASAALQGGPIVVHGDPGRRRDFLYVDDAVSSLEALLEGARWNETFTIGSGVATTLGDAAKVVASAVGGEIEIRTSGGALPPGENDSYTAGSRGPGLGFDVRSLEEAVQLYVDWLRRHTPAEGRARG